MAITIEVTRGRYLRHLRDRRQMTIREASDAMNALLPTDQRVTHTWLFQLEADSGRSKMTVLRALALHQVLGADLAHLEIPADDLQAVRLLMAGVDDGTFKRPNRPRGQPKRSSSCIVPRRSACPTGSVTSVPFAATHCKGWVRAYR
jgi:hypothetical protein